MPSHHKRHDMSPFDASNVDAIDTNMQLTLDDPKQNNAPVAQMQPVVASTAPFQTLSSSSPPVSPSPAKKHKPEKKKKQTLTGAAGVKKTTTSKTTAPRLSAANLALLTARPQFPLPPPPPPRYGTVRSTKPRFTIPPTPTPAPNTSASASESTLSPLDQTLARIVGQYRYPAHPSNTYYPDAMYVDPDAEPLDAVTFTAADAETDPFSHLPLEDFWVYRPPQHIAAAASGTAVFCHVCGQWKGDRRDSCVAGCEGE